MSEKEGCERINLAAPSLRSGSSSWRRSRARGDGAPRNSAAVETIPSAAPRIGVLSSGLLARSAKRPGSHLKEEACTGLRFRGFPGTADLPIQMIAVLRPDYRCAGKVRRRMRRRVRSRVLTSARTATRTFDLQLAIAAPPITRPSSMSRLERIRTLPVVHGGNRLGFLWLSPS